MKRSYLMRLRSLIEAAAASLPDEAALQGMELFPEWDGNGRQYVTGERLRFGGFLYRVLQDHTSQPGWTPEAAPSLFARVLIPDPGEIPEWVQPGSTNAYSKGDKVKHNGKTWVSDLDNNVWEPGVYGWSEVV